MVIVVALLAIAGYFVFVKQPSPPTETTQPSTGEEATTPTSGTEGGVGGSGLTVPPSKYCKDRGAPEEKVFGEALTISSDKKTILLNGKIAVSISDLPSTIQVSADSSFGVTNKEFTSAVLSPTKSIIAFTVSGGTHGWGGFKNVFSGLVYPVAFQFEGGVSNPKWNHDGKYVAFSKTTPKPATILTLVNAQELKGYTSEYEKTLIFEDINPLPSGMLSNLRSHYWSKDKDSKLYFLVALMDSAVNTEHAELWSVNADTSKWDFYCTSY